jgi:hypothetical protein
LTEDGLYSVVVLEAGNASFDDVLIGMLMPNIIELGCTDYVLQRIQWDGQSSSCSPNMTGHFCWPHKKRQRMLFICLGAGLLMHRLQSIGHS